MSGEWLIKAEYTDSKGARHSEVDFELRWADSYATGYHSSHVGECIQIALKEAKARVAKQKLRSQKKYG